MSTADAGVEINRSAEDLNSGVVEALIKFPARIPKIEKGRMKKAFRTANLIKIEASASFIICVLLIFGGHF
jgi:hypothetical protein